MPTLPESEGIKRIVPFGATPAATTPADAHQPSIYLYLSGLGVTLSALYAVTFELEQPAFMLSLFFVAILGYAVSFFVRSKNLPIKAIQTPMMVVVALFLLMAYTGESGLAMLFPVEDMGDRAKILQLTFAWFAVLQTFTIGVDSGILFQCVPCMTMIALASTHSSDQRIQYAFLLFTSSATFLMIHENFLRTRRGNILNDSSSRDKRLFGGQLQLAAICIVAAFLLANIVAVPIRNVGQSLGISQNLYGISRSQQQAAAASSRPMVISESASLDVSGGINETSTQIVMRVQSGRSRYWRGKTFDFYDGRAFKDTVGETKALVPEPAQMDDQRRYQEYTSLNSAADIAANANINRYAVPTSPLELAPEAMKGSSSLTQRVTLEGIFNQLYGAGNVTELRAGMTTIQYNTAGAFGVNDIRSIQNQYTVVSQVPTDDETLLRQSDPKAIPDNIRRIYLQLPPLKTEDLARMQTLTTEITKGKKTNYDKMEAIRDYLSHNVKYNLQVARAPADRDAVLHLIDDAKQGYCTGFAAAMTILCRVAGIPARVASGFLPGELDGRSQEHRVRTRDKHAWTEVYFADIGWVTSDATEGTDDVTPKESDNKNGGFLGWLKRQGVGATLLGIVCVVLFAYVVRTELMARLKRGPRMEASTFERHPANREIAALYQATVKAFGKRGLGRLPHFTPDEFTTFVAQKTADIPTLATNLSALTGLYARFIYGREIADASDVEQAKTLSAQLREALRQVKKK